MFPLGHIGIGTQMIPRRIRERLPWRWLAVGCLLPDLLDKPLYLTARLARRVNPGYLEMFAGSRLIGHTLVFVVALVAAASFVRSGRLRAMAWGVSTHLLLDLALDIAYGSHAHWRAWLLWPLFGRGFPPTLSMYPEGAAYIVGEVVGASLLAWDYARRRRARV